jgi:hypothetical protein
LLCQVPAASCDAHHWCASDCVCGFPVVKVPKLARFPWRYLNCLPGMMD